MKAKKSNPVVPQIMEGHFLSNHVYTVGNYSNKLPTVFKILLNTLDVLPQSVLVEITLYILLYPSKGFNPVKVNSLQSVQKIHCKVFRERLFVEYM